jgi:hypothetical protein
MTFPCLTMMTLFMVSTVLSAASMKARMPADETPCASGVLRGNGAALAAPAARTRLHIQLFFMFVIPWPLVRTVAQSAPHDQRHRGSSASK